MAKQKLERIEGVAPFATMSKVELLTCGDQRAAADEIYRRAFNKYVTSQSA